jgi:hypothetical protein
MKIYAISDLHLSFNSNKPMDIFGSHWEAHHESILNYWTKTVEKDDTVLIPGDISWAMKLEDAKQDLDFIGGLPGKKLIIKGNHDYWWQSLNKISNILHPSITPLQNSSYIIADTGIAGTRLWIDSTLSLEKTTENDSRLFDRELTRLIASVKSLPKGLNKTIVMTHFPPISPDGNTGRAVELLKGFKIDAWVFGHMHIDGNDYSGFNRTIGNTRFIFTSADCIGFKPVSVF